MSVDVGGISLEKESRMTYVDTLTYRTEVLYLFIRNIQLTGFNWTHTIYYKDMVQKMYLLNGVARIQHSQLPLCQDELCTCWTLVYTSVICRYFQHMVAICGNFLKTNVRISPLYQCTTYQDLPGPTIPRKELKGAERSWVFVSRSLSAIPSCCV